MTDRAMTLDKYFRNFPYPGRGILTGRSPDGSAMLFAYFLMGRSANSRNRVLSVRGGDVFAEPFDASKVADPRLILYPAVRTLPGKIIVTNGDQTDTIRNFLAEGKTFAEALATREFEPDAPNYTPRISALLTLAKDAPRYDMSILKSADAVGSACVREFFTYPALPGIGHLIHTYETAGDPLPSFAGEPRRIAMPGNADELSRTLWEALDPDNRISLIVRSIDLESGKVAERRINQREEETK